MHVWPILGFVWHVVDFVLCDYIEHVGVVCVDVCCCCVHACNGELLV